MNFAEGKGPKQVKTPYVLGQFVTAYGNGSTSNVNLASPPYPVSGVISGNVAGSVSPGLNINVNGNGATDIGFICAPSPTMSLQDIETLYADFWVNATFSGTVFLRLQGSNDRFIGATDYDSTAWVTILSGTTSSNNTAKSFTLNNAAAAVESPKVAYRVTASGTTTTSGIVDWILPSMFLDFNAMGVGSNAPDANGNIGQMSIQAPKNYTISGGQYTATASGNIPFANTEANHTWIG